VDPFLEQHRLLQDALAKVLFPRDFSLFTKQRTILTGPHDPVDATGFLRRLDQHFIDVSLNKPRTSTALLDNAGFFPSRGLLTQR
jgi:hypothetical protein